MEKITLDELRKILKELGHSDEEIEEVISKKEESLEEESEEKVEEEVEVEAAPEESLVAEEEGEPAPAEEPSTDESGESESEPVVEPEELPMEETPMEEAPVEEPVAEPAPEEALPEGVEEVDPNAPVAEEPAPTEPVDPGIDVQALMNRLDESEKAREGLQARVDALENALKEAGVLGEGSLPQKEVGVDDGTRVNDYHDDEQTFDDILNQINRGY